MRHTWLWLYGRAKRRSLNWSTRRSVHRSVPKPSATAPPGKCPHQLAALRGVQTRGSTPRATLERCQTARLELRVPLGHRRARYADASRHFGLRHTLSQQPVRPQAYEANVRSNGRNKSGGP